MKVCQDLSRMEKLEFHVVIKFLQLRGKTPTEVKVELNLIYGDAAPHVQPWKLGLLISNMVERAFSTRQALNDLKPQQWTS